MSEKLKSKLFLGQTTIWMLCMVAITIGITVLENVSEEFRYGHICLIVAITMLLMMPIAIAHINKMLVRIEADQKSGSGT